MDLGVLFRFHGMQNCNCLAQLQPLEGGGGRHGTHRIIKATESCKSDTASDRSERIPFPFGFLFTDGNTVDAPQSIPSRSGKKSQDVSTADRLSSTNLWASWDARACGAWSSRSRSDRFQGSDDYHSPLKKMYISELKAKYQVRGPTLIRNFQAESRSRLREAPDLPLRGSFGMLWQRTRKAKNLVRNVWVELCWVTLVCKQSTESSASPHSKAW